jgi:hypothetical protein
VFRDRSRAKAFVIIDDETLQQAADIRNAIDDKIKDVSEAFDPIVKYLDPLKAAKRAIGANMSGYHQEQERLRAVAEAKARAEALRQEEEMRLAEAVELEAAGETEAAEQLMEEPIHAPVVLAPAAPKPKGATFPETWKASVTNKLAFVQWVARHPHMLHLLDPNQKQLNQLARAQKDMMRVEGVEAVKVTGVARRR